MPIEQQFLALVSGKRRGPVAAVMRAGLRLAAVPYSMAVRLRNRRYDTQSDRVHRAGVPVVSVGNLTVGGTGKTPFVEWICRWFREHDTRVTIISRGYGARDGARNDEALELEQKLPDVPHVQNPDRVAAATMAIEEFECQALVLDDAFQHRRIARDLDIVLLDATSPFGYGHVLPAGTLREPATGLRRAHVIALSRADLIDAASRERIKQQALRFAPHATWLEVTHQPQALLNANGDRQDLDGLRDRRVAGFCGIGNPEAFRRTLQSAGANVVDFRMFPDHHAYGRDDIESLQRWAAESAAELTVCTHKDLVKLSVPQLGRHPLWAVVVALQIMQGEAELVARLLPLLPERHMSTR